jgi:hypothetical protein
MGIINQLTDNSIGLQPLDENCRKGCAIEDFDPIVRQREIVGQKHPSRSWVSHGANNLKLPYCSGSLGMAIVI